MRHLKRGRKLNRTPAHRKAMVRNLVTSLFVHGRVTTTPAKAKEARPFAEKMITLAKKGDLNARRRAVSKLQDAAVVKSLFEVIGPRYQERPGGYTRILHLDTTRVGDSAPQVIFELVEAEMPERKKGQGQAVRAAVEPSAAPTSDEQVTDSEADTSEQAPADAPASEESEKDADAEASVDSASDASEDADGSSEKTE